MRAQVLEVKEREHVEAAIAAGARPRRVLLTHISCRSAGRRC